jgi:hypothetical protein
MTGRRASSIYNSSRRKQLSRRELALGARKMILKAAARVLGEYGYREASIVRNTDALCDAGDLERPLQSARNFIDRALHLPVRRRGLFGHRYQ